MKNIATIAALIGAVSFSSHAAAQDITMAGTVISSCVLTVPTPGVLVPATDGTRIGTEEGVGGLPATLTVVALGSTPTVNFAAPTVAGPAGATGLTSEVAYTSAGSGANQAYTSSPSSASSDLLDSFTVQGRVSGSNGFPQGLYTMTVTVTCSQS
ncbi:hypothetical protein [Pontixanthobacter aquaemixtae]|uniref:Spore coat protein U domain-containing protein n=1 Tax=Pontixanthobacter aquaemixtae TaxID=1958940 RepID=A0A844ZX39_9SPHN|nr:hypothetical protein [Pontixanthobacter aquaemixtae]MXO91792.1 hypothetical protein [Pontixanthobacter aquaemixtae]